jgi:hypothetical protein
MTMFDPVANETARAVANAKAGLNEEAMRRAGRSMAKNAGLDPDRVPSGMVDVTWAEAMQRNHEYAVREYLLALRSLAQGEK